MKYSENQKNNLIRLALSKINYTDELKEYIEYIKANSKDTENVKKECEEAILDFENMIIKEYSTIIDDNDIDMIISFINSTAAKKIFNKDFQKNIRLKILDWQSNKMPKIKGILTIVINIVLYSN
jgi:translation initiation factor 2B subunit (eIF-2B alpha/beta/delta family)